MNTIRFLSSLLRIFFVFGLCFSLFGQKQYNVKISFPINIDTSKINIIIDDGIDSKPKSITKYKNFITFKGDFLQKYAFLTVSYEGLKYYSNKFWINDKAASIDFISKDTNQNFLKIHEIKNALDLQNNGEKKFNSYIEVESKELDSFLLKSGNNRNDSLTTIFFKLTDKLNAKMISFVKENPLLYYSIHLYRYNLSNFFYINPDSLKMNFYKIFTKNLQNSYEGKEILKILNGRILSKGNPVPKFISQDTNFKTFNSNDFKNKYYLIVFWASWCKPCLEEIPKFNDISDKYSKNQIEFLFVNIDNSIEKFNKSKTKYSKEWSQVYGDKNIVKVFGIVSLPQVFLIDKSGIIIYSKDKEKDKDLKILNQILISKNF